MTVDLPIDRITANLVFKDSSTAEATMIGVYTMESPPSIGGFMMVDLTIYTGLTADEMSTIDDYSYGEYRDNAIKSTATYYSWSDGYNIIYHANAVIEGLSVSQLSEGQKLRLTAEAKFIRALNYFYLYHLFGNIPLATTTDYEVNRLLPRADSAAVYELITADLKEAKQYLPETYDIGKKRATKWAATALLARVYLYQQKWEEAIEESSAVINSHKFNMVDPGDVFLSSSDEAILQFEPSTTIPYGVAAAYYFVPYPDSRPTFTVNDIMINAFENDDLRLTNWVNHASYAGNDYIYPAKYKIREVPLGVGKPESCVVLRLAEQYLIRAEAYIRINNSDASIEDIDKVRSRAGLATVRNNLPVVSKEQIFNAIIQENKIEFLCELGHRWIDLKRWGLVDAVLSAFKGPAKWQSTDALYPLPMSEIQLNPSLTQNPGYQ